MDLDDALVRRLVDAQFPHWAGLPIRQVLPGGLGQPHVPAGR
jgi:hypothetical protein